MTKDKLSPFRFHGLNFTRSGSQSNSICPFCSAETKFFASDEGKWDCKRCGEKGNVYSFIRLLHETAIKTTTAEQYTSLSSQRGLSVATLKRHKLAMSPILGEWLLPIHRADKKLVNLYRYSGGKLLSTPNLKHHPFGIDLITKKRPLWIVEGHWDYMALDQILRSQKKRSEFDILAVPGCHSFREEWLEHLHGREVTICYDNDHPKKLENGRTVQPGRDGIKKVVRLIESNGVDVKSLSIVNWGGKRQWSTKLPTGFDIRDLLIKYGEQRSFSFLQKRTKEHELSIDDPAPVVDSIECTSFDSLVSHFEESLYFTRSMRDTLAVILACAISTNMQSDPLWMYVVGPPSSGKSTLVECLAASREHTKMISKLTGMHSGWKDNSGKDASLIPLVQGRTLIIKDGTALMTQGQTEKERVFGELRDIYDGTSSSQYRNKQAKDYQNINLSIVIATTDEVRADNRSTLGERFLMCEILDGDHDPDEHVSTAISNMLSCLPTNKEDSEEQTKLIKPRIQGATRGYLEHLLITPLPAEFTALDRPPGVDSKPLSPLQSHVLLPRVPKVIERQILHLARLVAQLRANVKRTRDDDLIFRARPEVGLRIAGQLTKLAVCLAIVLQKSFVDEEVYNIVRKVAFDTVRGFSFDIVSALAPDKSMSYGELAPAVDLGESSVKRKIIDLIELRVVQRESKPNNSGQRGRNRHVFELTPIVKELWQRTGA